jgi:heme/copper-type cytochrome/quinol oxidase subunit 2
MNDLLGTALVIVICFAIGVVVGIITVIAMAAIRSDRGQKPPEPPAPANLGTEPPAWSNPTDLL